MSRDSTIASFIASDIAASFLVDTPSSHFLQSWSDFLQLWYACTDISHEPHTQLVQFVEMTDALGQRLVDKASANFLQHRFSSLWKTYFTGSWDNHFSSPSFIQHILPHVLAWSARTYPVDHRDRSLPLFMLHSRIADFFNTHPEYQMWILDAFLENTTLYATYDPAYSHNLFSYCLSSILSGAMTFDDRAGIIHAMHVSSVMFPVEIFDIFADMAQEARFTDWYLDLPDPCWAKIADAVSTNMHAFMSICVPAMSEHPGFVEKMLHYCNWPTWLHLRPQLCALLGAVDARSIHGQLQSMKHASPYSGFQDIHFSYWSTMVADDPSLNDWFFTLVQHNVSMHTCANVEQLYCLLHASDVRVRGHVMLELVASDTPPRRIPKTFNRDQNTYTYFRNASYASVLKTYLPEAIDILPLADMLNDLVIPLRSWYQTHALGLRLDEIDAGSLLQQTA